MTDADFADRRAAQPWLKLAALVLLIAALGLPVNDLVRYALLVVATVIVVAGTVSPRVVPWLGAIGVVALCVLAQILFPAPRIEEGHNVFLMDDAGENLSVHLRERGGPPAAPGSPLSRGRADNALHGAHALEAELPREAFRIMAAEFDATYPRERRCAPAQDGCWRGHALPAHAFAFSADGIFQRPAYSRRVTAIDFSDPVWLRLGFINELAYNWNSQISDIARAQRDRRSLAFLQQWTLKMPWFVMYRFPADFSGSDLCWRGEVLWEGAHETFEAIINADMQCRTLTAADVGRRIFGVAIAHELAMRLKATWPLRLRQLLEPTLALIAGAAVLALLARVRPRRLVLPFALIAATLLVALLNDASFLGGARPFDSGDDGLVYDGYARIILRRLIAGDLFGALEGGEAAFYFTPGLRYLRAAEHIFFGETYLGYLSLILLLPFLVFALFRRFLPLTWALALTLIFAAIPVGVGFGSSLVQYVKWAARGFADPAAYVLFLAAFVLLLGRATHAPRTRSAPSPLVGGGGSEFEATVVHDRDRPAVGADPSTVIAGLDPAIHPIRKKGFTKAMDPRVNPRIKSGDAGDEDGMDVQGQRQGVETQNLASSGFARAFGAGLLFALALTVRPNIAPAAGILLAGAGLAALVQREFRRVAGLVLGFAAVLGMALHNWVYGGVFALFTTSAGHPLLLTMPPSAYLAALADVARLDFFGAHVTRALQQIGGWLAGPSESVIMAPLNAAAIVIVIRVMLWKAADPWLRLTAVATLAQHGVALFYAGSGRYYYLTWLLTFLVAAAWLHGEGLDLVRRHFPAFSERIAKHPARLALGRGLTRMAAMLER